MLELPALQRFSEDAELQGVRVVTVVSGEEVPKARDLLAKVRYTFPVVFDAESRVADSYKVSAVPQVVIVTEGRVKARFVGEGRFHRLVDAIRAETGVSEVDQAGSSGEEPIPLVERGGRYVMAGESKGNWSVPINRGKWTRLPDGPYVDSVTGEVLVVVTARGPAFTAGNAASTRAFFRWGRLVDSVCPASARITAGNVDMLGPFAAPYLKLFAGWPMTDLVAQIPSCDSQVKPVIYVAPNEAKTAQRILWSAPPDAIIYEVLERWTGAEPGEKRPVGPNLRNHLTELTARLKSEGRVVADALR